MSLAEIDGDTSYLTRMIAGFGPSPQQLQDELQEVFNAFETQWRAAKVQKTQWRHIRDEEPSPQQLQDELQEVFNAFETQWRAAKVTKERITRIGSRFVLTSVLFRKTRFERDGAPLHDDELQQKCREIVSKMNELRKELDDEIADVVKYTNHAERQLRNCQLYPNTAELTTIFRREAEKVAESKKETFMSRLAELQVKIEQQASEITSLKEKVEERGQDRQVPPLPTNDEEKLNAAAKELDDDAYWENMVLEVRETSPPPTKARKREPERLDPLREWEMEVEDMERDYRNFPYRKKEFTSLGIQPRICCAFCDVEGQHYSDSCPVYTESRLRYKIIQQKKLCASCLENCPGGNECSQFGRPCWYCSRVARTSFEDLIPRRHHHRALCEVPDLKKEAARRLENEQAYLQLERNRAAGVSTKSTKKGRSAENERANP
ncbi:unnamed protein product [Nippostrongylus brasiliensis]|uniref:CCHC-type domain-containing protein n=1 Tax=Nippostrongylus brasiliensis TaxID=27835 RepID=A0A0N4YI80_NIPBR|nr:unnamed protein product [Nippostrongylus brasiliensis]